MIQNGTQGAFVENAARSRPLLAGATRREDANTAEEQFLAAQYVARKALDEEDGSELLQMLGLVEPPWEWVGRTHPRRRVER
jgi:hypothetical protein